MKSRKEAQHTINVPQVNIKVPQVHNMYPCLKQLTEGRDNANKST